MALDRTWYNTLVDDDGSGLSGSVWDKADVDALMDAIDAEIARLDTYPYWTHFEAAPYVWGDLSSVTGFIKVGRAASKTAHVVFHIQGLITSSANAIGYLRVTSPYGEHAAAPMMIPIAQYGPTAWTQGSMYVDPTNPGQWRLYMNLQGAFPSVGTVTIWSGAFTTQLL